MAATVPPRPMTIAAMAVVSIASAAMNGLLLGGCTLVRSRAGDVQDAARVIFRSRWRLRHNTRHAHWAELAAMILAGPIACTGRAVLADNIFALTS
jgi:hypothetical protein